MKTQEGYKGLGKKEKHSNSYITKTFESETDHFNTVVSISLH